VHNDYITDDCNIVDGGTTAAYKMAGATVAECDLCIVYNAEADAWRDYITRLVTQFVTEGGATPLRVHSVDDTSLTRPGHRLPRSAIVIVVLSPSHLDFLRCQQNVLNYRTLVDHHATDALVLRCGVPCFSDIADQDNPIFNQFFGWTKLEDIDNGQPVTKAVGRLLSKRCSVQAQDEQIYLAPTNDVVNRRRGSSPSMPLVCSSASSNRSSNRSSAGGGVFAETSDDATPHFRVIPTTVRCEVRSQHIFYHGQLILEYRWHTASF